MKPFALILCLPLMASDVTDLGTLNEQSQIMLTTCHANDAIIVRIEPLNAATNRVGGGFVTRKAMLTWDDLSMAPDGTNMLLLRTVCAGKTSKLSVATFTMHRRPPQPAISLAGMPTKPTSPPLPFVAGFIASTNIVGELPTYLPGKYWPPFSQPGDSYQTLRMREAQAFERGLKKP